MIDSEELRLEEDFDLFKLGFSGDQAESAGASERGNHDNKPGTRLSSCPSPEIESLLPPLIPTDKRPPKPSRPSRLLSGRYCSADWEPDSDRAGPSQNGQLVGIHDHDHIVSPPMRNDEHIWEPPNRNGTTSHEDDGDRGCPPISTKTSLYHAHTPLPANQSPHCETPLEVPPAGDRSPFVVSGTLSTVESVPSPSRPKPFTAQLVRVKRKNGKGYRTGIRIRSLNLTASIGAVDENSDIADSISQVAADPPLSPSFRSELLARFGRDAFERIEKFAVGDNTSGVHFPAQLRDLFPALNDATAAIQIVNTARLLFDLPSMPDRKSTRIALRRVIAKMRIKLYTELMSALTLPFAPDPPESDSASEHDEKEIITLTPTNLTAMSKALPGAFPQNKADLKAFLPGEMEAAYGERGGSVVWQNGIGRVLGGHSGFRGKIEDGDVHVFVDHSNILHGLTHCLYSSASDSLPPRHLRTLSLPCLSLLLRRGRPTPPGTLHLVASSPLQQNLDPLVRLGWEVSVLKRVEVYQDEVEDPTVMHLVAKPMARIPSGGGGSRRFKEQGVDEILHLKILQTLNAHTAVRGKSKIILATGDARGGQFNRDGFMGAVKEAMKRDWAVELWSFRAGLSRAWYEVAKRERWDRSFEIRVMDEWAEMLVEVGEGDQ